MRYETYIRAAFYFTPIVKERYDNQRKINIRFRFRDAVIGNERISRPSTHQGLCLWLGRMQLWWLLFNWRMRIVGLQQRFRSDMHKWKLGQLQRLLDVVE
jgi:hypothetical protein